MSLEPQKIDIDELLRDSILVIVQLKAKATILEEEKLYEICKKHVTSVQEQLYNAQYSQAVIDKISYALCAILDESVMLHHDKKDENHGKWQGVPLQVLFFNSNNAGNELYERIRSHLRSDKRETLVLSCYDRVLGLGFQGCYLLGEQQEREHLVIALREALRESEQDQTYPIIEQTKTYHYWGRKALLLAGTVTSVVAVCILYFVLNNQLDQLINQLIG
ncbi:type VI secretion system protein TssL, short form [Orbaceae bacterium ESL0721]|nr:type VI secretion system protein TssL, short form [Orbaceae bacterium ESL0721]